MNAANHNPPCPGCQQRGRFYRMSQRTAAMLYACTNKRCGVQTYMARAELTVSA